MRGGHKESYSLGQARRCSHAHRAWGAIVPSQTLIGACWCQAAVAVQGSEAQLSSAHPAAVSGLALAGARAATAGAGPKEAPTVTTSAASCPLPSPSSASTTLLLLNEYTAAPVRAVLAENETCVRAPSESN